MNRRVAHVVSGLLVALAILALPQVAGAQATRTWVSGVGDDANPCSRTAPCKTFAGAISKTAAGGEIDALDPGGYGTVTITKSITISGVGTQASILASGINGVLIAAGANDQVNLNNISINGLTRGSASQGTNGVRITGAGTVRLEHVQLMGGSQNGVDYQPTTATSPQPRLVIEDSTIEGFTGAGLQVIAQTAAGARATVINSHVDENGCGITVGGSCSATAGSANAALATTVNSYIDDNGPGAGGAGIQSVGSTAANIIGGDTVSGNGIGLSTVGSPAGSILSYGDNYVIGNGSNGVTPGALSPRSAAVSETKVMHKLKKRARAIRAKKAHRKAKRHHHRRV